MTTRQLSETRNYLAVVEETRRNEAYVFETATTVFEMVTRACDEAVIILEEIWAGEGSFIQLGKHFNKMLKSAVKLRKAHLFAGIMNTLAQVASKDLQVDEALFERVKTLLLNYKDKITTEF